MTPQEIRDEILGKYNEDGSLAIASLWPREDYVKYVAENATDGQIQVVADEICGVLAQVEAIGVYATICSRVDVLL